MFEETIRELRRLERQQQIFVPVAADSEGYFDRECPSSGCLFQFKVHEEDWRDRVRDEEVFCPFCGHIAESGQWWSQEQIEHAKKAAVAHLQGRIGRALKHDATRWNGASRATIFCASR
jgi:hypothetical protein